MGGKRSPGAQENGRAPRLLVDAGEEYYAEEYVELVIQKIPYCSDLVVGYRTLAVFKPLCSPGFPIISDRLRPSPG